MNQLLLTLRFYATGSMQITAGDFSGVHQTTAGKTIKRVTKVIAANRFNHLKLHLSPIKQQQNQTGFYSIARFLCVYGALDYTHIRLQSPGGQNYRNRKGYFSSNVQAVCTSNLNFLDVASKFASIAVPVKTFVLSININKHPVIVIKSLYFTRTTKPTVHSVSSTTNNESHIRTRSCIERRFGIWKRRFPVLSIGMRVNLELVQDIIVACTFCIIYA
ncbi:uncharacterized protein LOC114251465 [Bombyx mandarina]|uniref:Uncharacterized protein LOC114251465 n=1 Tax=Bombyx mandarina TaxID=7092 RepID=A0A6J2KN39_BOMMA|nr:uncharacterized protein LOC114251465 [Bombyx mandarina]